MYTLVYRIAEVLSGQAADTAVIATDPAGRELRLELSAEQARAMKPGQLLILHASVHALPPVWGPAPVPTTTPTPTPTPPTATACAQRDGEDEVCRLLGLS